MEAGRRTSTLAYMFTVPPNLRGCWRRSSTRVNASRISFMSMGVRYGGLTISDSKAEFVSLIQRLLLDRPTWGTPENALQRSHTGSTTVVSGNPRLSNRQFSTAPFKMLKLAPSIDPWTPHLTELVCPVRRPSDLRYVIVLLAKLPRPLTALSSVHFP